MICHADFTFGLAIPLSSWAWNLAPDFRAIQKSIESPTIAPSAPATMTRTSSSSPLAAIVEAALSVVSPGKSG